MTYKQHEELKDKIIEMIHLRCSINSQFKELGLAIELPNGCENISDTLTELEDYWFIAGRRYQNNNEEIA